MVNRFDLCRSRALLEYPSLSLDLSSLFFPFFYSKDCPFNYVHTYGKTYFISQTISTIIQMSEMTMDDHCWLELIS